MNKVYIIEDRPDYKLRLKEIKDLIREAKDVFNQLDRAQRKIDTKYEFSSMGFLRGNFIGNLLRGNKVHAVNSNIDRVQQALLDFHAHLLLFDEDLAEKISLPSKMSQFSSADNKISDILIRTDMRLKGFDVSKSKRSVQVILRKLNSLKKKAEYEISKEKELTEYYKDKNKGKL